MSNLTRRHALRLGLLVGSGFFATIAENILVHHSEIFAQAVETTDMTTQPTSVLSNHPPFIPAPENATPVIVVVELNANNSEALEEHLLSAGIIPTTCLASGINYRGK
ncbi:MAG: hypothetical protein IGS38_13065 [Synechococcales cyanobacterium M58_A2018_015]|nr:hypothetical protein [Synechococcales cyanobacterium M58_A2018_015]